MGTIQENGAHAYERVAFYAAAVENSAVADRYIFPDCERKACILMEDTSILNIASGSDVNRS